ncbi:hypothetical protein H2199_005382 [Coniosporium tulheliwenetii]|uniref:Uncharacterized protein n=1 Tax=Coniosporium tulheliwenetii TaxID=3383036 RepID=A0ACC2Z1L3_9PEZI|nr:hypothetical protein H2199_005382 [Cladosporium sp. JES 115]
MATDCCSRVSELIAPGNPQNGDKCLRWSHVELFAFQEEAGITLMAKITYEGLKGRGIDLTRRKVIPLRLLPLELAAEDTLFQLIIVGLIDQVFENVSFWKDIEELRPGPNGTRVRIKDSESGMPVFRRVSTSHVVTDEPMRYDTVHSGLKALGRAAGFEGSLVTYCFRRGISYSLAMNCTEEERTARMGHKSGDSTYWTHYRNQTSTVDFQAVFRGIPAVDMTPLSSISLDSRSDAPKSLSPEGWRAVHCDAKVIELTSVEIDRLDLLLGKYGTLQQAAAQDREAYDRYKEARIAANSERQRLRVALFEKEYKAFSRGPTSEEQITEQALTIEALAEPDFLDPPSPKDSIPVDPLLQESTFPSTVGLESLVLEKDGDVPIDPLLLQESTFDQVSATPEPDPTTLSTILAAEEARQITIDNGREIIEQRASQQGRNEVIIAPWTVVDDVPAAMFGRGPTSRVDLIGYLIDAFNHIHVIDQFYPGQEPLPGTWKCRFCSKALAQCKHPDEHSYWCQKAAMLKATEQRLQSEYTLMEECNWITSERKRYCGKKDFADLAAQFDHVRTHVNRTNPRTCRFGACANAEKPLTFSGSAALFSHILREHKIFMSFAKPPNSPNALLYVHWCCICSRWLCTLDVDIEAHALAHRETVSRIVRDAGYAGRSLSKKTIQPGLCPFCLHDTSLDWADRIHCHHPKLPGHIHSTHLKAMGEDALISCPASNNAVEIGIEPTCDVKAAMTKAEFITHLEQCHSISIQPPKKRLASSEEIEHPAKDAKKARPAEGELKAKFAVRRVLQPTLPNADVRDTLKAAALGNVGQVAAGPGAENQAVGQEKDF